MQQTNLFCSQLIRCGNERTTTSQSGTKSSSFGGLHIGRKKKNVWHIIHMNVAPMKHFMTRNTLHVMLKDKTLDEVPLKKKNVWHIIHMNVEPMKHFMTRNTLHGMPKDKTLDEVPLNLNVPATGTVYEHQQLSQHELVCHKLHVLIPSLQSLVKLLNVSTCVFAL
jgi:hypothetical protein